MKIGDIQGSQRIPNLGRTRDGLASYAKAKRSLKTLSADERAETSSQWTLARALAGEAGLLRDLKEHADARASNLAALAIMKAVPEDSEFDYQLAARTAMLMFGLVLNNGDIAAAKIHSDECLDIATRWSKADPSAADARYWIGVANSMNGQSLAMLGDPDGSVRALGQSASIYAQLVVEYPDNAAYRRELRAVRSFEALGSSGLGQAENFYPSVGDMAAGEREYREALPLAELAVSRDPKDLRSLVELAFTLDALAAVVGTRDPEAALPTFQRAREIFAALPDSMRSSPYARPFECAGQCDMAVTLAKLRRRDAALEAAARGLAIAVKTAAASPSDSDARMGQWSCLYKGARTSQILGDKAEAQRKLEEALAGLKKESAAQASFLPPYVGLVDSYRLLAEVQPERRCDLLRQASEVWASWPGAPTTYTRRRAVELTAAQRDCPPHP